MAGENSRKRLLNESPSLSVGILTADLLNLGSELKLLKEAGAKLVHIDVMDGVYCPWMTVRPDRMRVGEMGQSADFLMKL